MNKLDLFYNRLDELLSRIEAVLPAQQPNTDLDAAIAFRWRKQANTGYLQPVTHPHNIVLDALYGIDQQKQLIDQNTYQFVLGYPANNVLLTGARGTGKSSLVKALLNKYANKGLRLIEVEKHDLIDLHDIVERVFQRPERFIVYCDDLSFESDEPGYKALKVVLDGSIEMASDNVLIYATSNRRHLLPEAMRDNLETRHVDGDIHPSETIEERISLSERFGIWLSFYSFDQAQYLEIVRYWLAFYGIKKMTVSAREEALRWALTRGSRSGRVAWQFARDWAGKRKLYQLSQNNSM
ncbi:ATP-binding protein [Nitrosomonas communis]|uniref:ATP-binding protein n=1 Tax=Nitrosomonas communis TaxID=44574 RepID=UPI003D2849F9